MRILSKFKDYYDFVGKRYGEDPACVYLRRSFQRTCIAWPHEEMFRDKLIDDYQMSHKMVFVVAAKWCIPFLCRRSFSGPDTMARLMFPAHDALLKSRRVGRTDVPQRPVLPEGERLEALVRTVGAPVFTVGGWGGREKEPRSYLEVEEAVPVLGRLGFASLVPPEQMWQEVYSCLQNVVRTSPDRAPPVEVADEYKIHAAGFDERSFRHPTNPMPRKSRRTLTSLRMR